MAQKRITGWKVWALNIFIALHVLGLFFWGLPDSGFRNRMARPFERYIVYMGLWHIWGMFAPAPLDTHFDVRAEIKYQDGSTIQWRCPRPDSYPVLQRAHIERYRKWSERLRADEFMMIWKPAAAWIARNHYKNPKNPPVEIKFTRHWIPLPKPDMKHDYQPMPKGFTPNQEYTYATIPISPKDLQ